MEPASPKSMLARVRALLFDRVLFGKAVSFAGVGVINTLADFGLFSFARLYLGLSILAANAIAWIIAVSGSYVMNSMITFAAESQRKLRFKAYVSYLGAQVAGFVGDTVTVYVVAHLVTILLGGALAVDPSLVGKVFGLGVSFLLNFSLSHFFVFRSPARAKPEDAR
jgi:putative flippase GtrA